VERIINIVERAQSTKKGMIVFMIIAAIGPIYFLNTVYAVWFGPEEVLYGFKSERDTFLILAIVNGVTFLTTLPAREKGRVIQVTMAAWVVEMSLVFLATVIR